MSDNPLSISRNDARDQLVNIAVTADPEDDIIQQLSSSDIGTQLKAFTVAQARMELMRVIQLTDSLNELEDTYIKRAMEDKDGMDMKSLEQSISVIMRSLERSNSLIDKVTKDENIQLILDQSSTVVNNQRSLGSVNILEDQGSREKVRNVASQLLNVLEVNPNTIVHSKPLGQGDDEDE